MTCAETGPGGEMTEERLEEIRAWLVAPGHADESFYMVHDLLAEVERLQHDAELTSKAIQDAVDRYENGVM